MSPDKNRETSDNTRPTRYPSLSEDAEDTPDTQDANCVSGLAYSLWAEL